VIEAQSLGTFHDRNPLSAASTDPLIHDTNLLPVASTAPFYSVPGGGEGAVLWVEVFQLGENRKRTTKGIKGSSWKKWIQVVPHYEETESKVVTFTCSGHGSPRPMYCSASHLGYLTLRSVASLYNPQNSEMKFCENMKLTC
jgi:hypothetical protein